MCRSELRNKCNLLKEKNEKDKTAFEIELKDLQRIIDHNNQLNKFMTKKANERLTWKQETENRIKRYGT